MSERNISLLWMEVIYRSMASLTAAAIKRSDTRFKVKALPIQQYYQRVSSKYLHHILTSVVKCQYPDHEDIWKGVRLRVELIYCGSNAYNLSKQSLPNLVLMLGNEERQLHKNTYRTDFSTISRSCLPHVSLLQ